MAYWLFKSEPDTWSWDDQLQKGDAGEEWDGVRNHAAKKYMQAMEPGDLGFFYHSGAERRIVGIVKISAAAHPDSSDETGKWFCVDIVAEKPLPTPVTLGAIKTEPRLKKMVLVRQARLSVQPVTEAEWQIVCTMGGLKKPPVSA